ncbi:hypothetical protein K439DRAFT_326594 [Ramaria rubella]|nr:hypothetical protein K439DRAFT_326594 [Ramaria rubella]
MSEATNGAAPGGTLNADFKLPPAALRLPTLEFDPTGNPYYKFPPFLSPPDGVPLIPFDKFRPHGIEINLDSDVEELDGDGIPTVELSAKHGDKEKKRKKKKTKREGDESQRKVSFWYDDWNEGEDLRRADAFDPNTPRIDRFAQGAADFHQSRKWTPGLQSLYDHFRHFVGLLGNPNQRMRFGKGGGNEEADDEADDESNDDEAELSAEQEKEEVIEEMKPPVIDVGGHDQDNETRLRNINADYQADEEDKEMRLDAFLNDPEEGIKIFFSSFYKNKGLCWSGPKLRDGPILLSFFLSFFIRNCLMPDYDKAFRKAHRICEQARLELPQTTLISMAIPDTFGSACTEVWESQLPTAWKGKNAMYVDDAEPESVKEWKAELKEQGLEEVSVDAAPGGWDSEPVPDGWGTPMDGVEAETEAPGWGNVMAPAGDVSDPWGAPGDAQDWGTSEKKSCLISILGPTSLPLTHAVQLVEKATRQIVSITPPDPAQVGLGLGGVLACVVLAPWRNPKEASTIMPPELVLDAHPEDSTFDMARDLIKVWVDVKTMEVMKEGLGLHALFVKVGGSRVGKVEEREKGKKRSRGKGKSKMKASDDREWWYIEFLYEVIPSFWTDEGE